jgi:catechol 2,3-dioxygenase-like lactoylglutathione lyase family enzyme
MTISVLHHIKISTSKLEETRDFYERVLGLYVGARPDFGEEGYWLFIPGTDHPVVHLSLNSRGGPEKTAQAGTRVDHVAFFGFELEKTLAHLDSLGVAYEKLEERLYLNEKMVQVFLEDPNGIKVELGFFPQREELFRESMEQYQAKAREGDAKIRGGK